MVDENMPRKEQHKLYLGGLLNRNIAYDMFSIVKDLLSDHYKKENDKAEVVNTPKDKN